MFFFKYFTVKLHVNLIRDIDTLERYSKDFKSITGSCCCSRVGTRAKLWEEGEERARASRPVPRGHDGYVFSPPLSTLHSPLTTLCSPISSSFESSVESLEGTKRLTSAPASAESCECPEARSRDWACLGW